MGHIGATAANFEFPTTHSGGKRGNGNGNLKFATLRRAEP
jgi:hypothetical protein